MIENGEDVFGTQCKKRTLYRPIILFENNSSVQTAVVQMLSRYFRRANLNSIAQCRLLCSD